MVNPANDGSPQSATVKIEGVPITGIIDTGSDITIISGDMFKIVIVKAGLMKEEFKTANKQAFTNGLLWMDKWMSTSALETSRYALLFM